jgi:hypothetical protein
VVSLESKATDSKPQKVVANLNEHMNKQQTKILLTKILPKFFIIALVVSGIIAFFAIRILGANAEKEAEEFWKNPKNKEKIEKAINSNN